MVHRNYLTSRRRRYALSEEELANLCGYVSRAAVHRFEQGLRIPTLRFVIACELIFGEHPRHLFPSLYERVEDEVLGHAAKLDAAIRDKKTKTAARQRELLLGIAHRAGNAREA